jgi:hypothetical protein
LFARSCFTICKRNHAHDRTEDLELNQPRYLRLEVSEPLATPAVQEISSDPIRLLRAATNDGSGLVTSEESIGGREVIRGGNQEVTDGSSRSAARWREVVSELVNNGLLEDTARGTFKVTVPGSGRAVKAEASGPTELTLDTFGPPGAQVLRIRSSRIVRLRQLEFLTSTDVCITSLSTLRRRQ